MRRHDGYPQASPSPPLPAETPTVAIRPSPRQAAPRPCGAHGWAPAVRAPGPDRWRLPLVSGLEPYSPGPAYINLARHSRYPSVHTRSGWRAPAGRSWLGILGEFGRGTRRTSVQVHRPRLSGAAQRQQNILQHPRHRRVRRGRPRGGLQSARQPLQGHARVYRSVTPGTGGTATALPAPQRRQRLWSPVACSRFRRDRTASESAMIQSWHLTRPSDTHVRTGGVVGVVSGSFAIVKPPPGGRLTDPPPMRRRSYRRRRRE